MSWLVGSQARFAQACSQAFDKLVDVVFAQ